MSNKLILHKDYRKLYKKYKYKYLGLKNMIGGTFDEPIKYNMLDLIEKHRIQGIIFDKDGTLINSEEWLRESINLALIDIIQNENKEIIKFIIEGKTQLEKKNEQLKQVLKTAEAVKEKQGKELYTVENHMDTISMSNFHNFDENLKQLLEKHNLLNPNTSKDYKEDYIKFFKTKYRYYQEVLKIDNFLKLTSYKLSEHIPILKKKKLKLAINSSGTYDKYNENLQIKEIGDLLSQFGFVLLDKVLIDNHDTDAETEPEIKYIYKETKIEKIKKKPNPDTYTFIAQSLFGVTENDMDKIMVVEDTAKGALAAIRANVGIIIINTNGQLDLVKRKFLEYNRDDCTSIAFRSYIKKEKLIFVDNLDSIIAKPKKD
jgi:beta-phosphoglucomutase-like phosphatase (HAD superfamily)